VIILNPLDAEKSFNITEKCLWRVYFVTGVDTVDMEALLAEHDAVYACAASHVQHVLTAIASQLRW
jgi:hypothetical protein